MINKYKGETQRKKIGLAISLFVKKYMTIVIMTVNKIIKCIPARIEHHFLIHL